ncbi:unnamed protein product, partial [Scytosiphon promiscuus]
SPESIRAAGEAAGEGPFISSRGLTWSRRSALRRSISSVPSIYTPATASRFATVASSSSSSSSSPPSPSPGARSMQLPAAAEGREGRELSDAAVAGSEEAALPGSLAQQRPLQGLIEAGSVGDDGYSIKGEGSLVEKESEAGEATGEAGARPG